MGKLYLKDNLNTIKTMIDGNSWVSWLFNIYTGKFLYFKPFLLERDEDFPDIIEDLLEHLDYTYKSKLLIRTAKFLSIFSNEKWEDFSRPLEVLYLAKAVFIGNASDFLVNTRQIIFKYIPDYSKLNNENILEIDAYLRLICSSYYEYTTELINVNNDINSANQKTLIFNQMHTNLFLLRRGIFHSFNVKFENQFYIRFAKYYFIIKLLVSQKNGIVY